MMRYLSYLLCFIIFSSTHPLGEVYEGQVTGLYTALKDEYRYLSPIYGLILLRNGVLKNIRFYGNYGSENSDYICQRQLTEVQRQVDCPQDHVAVLIQQFFPSPSGGQLIADQSKSFISELKLQTIGRILRLLHDGILDPNQLALEIYQHQTPDRFYQSALKYITNLNKKISQQIKDEQDLSIRKILKKTKEKLALLISRNDQRSKNYNPGIAIDDLTPEQWQELASEKSYQAPLSLASMIIEAVKETQKNPQDYPPLIIEHTLLAFLWKKAGKKEDFLDFFVGLGQDTLNEHHKNELGTPPFTQLDYQEWRQLIEDDPSYALAFIKNPENFLFLTLGYDLFDTPYPRILDYAQALYPAPSADESLSPGEIEKRSYADCGETSLRNFFNAFLYDQQTQSFSSTFLNQIAPNASESLKLFYQKQTPENLEAMRNAWSDVVSQVPGVTYRIPQQCNIKGSLTNLLTVVVALLNDDKLNTIHVGNDSSLEKAAQIFDRLCELISESRNNFDVTWKVQDAPPSHNHQISSDTDTKIEFSINGTPTFVWSFEPRHFDFELIKKESLSPWRQIVLDDLTATLSMTDPDINLTFVQNILPFYVSAQTVNQVLKAAPKPLVQSLHSNLIYGLSLDNTLDKIKAIVIAYKYNTQADSPLIQAVENRWIKSIPQDHLSMGSLYNNLVRLSDRLLPQTQHVMTSIEKRMHSNPEPYITPAAEYGWTQVMQYLVDHNLLDASNARDQYGRTALHIAAEYGNHHIVDLLITHAPFLLKDPYLVDKQGKTPLHWAADYGHQRAAKSLIQNAPIMLSPGYLKDHKGKTPLHRAAQYGHRRVADLFIKTTPIMLDPLYIKDNEGKSPLHLSAEYGQTKLTQFLIENTPILLELFMLKDKKGKSPLHWAAEYGQYKVVHLLIDEIPVLLDGNFPKKTNLIKDRAGYSPLHIAAEYGQTKVVKQLINRAPILLEENYLQDYEGTTPLHLAAEYGHLDVVKILVSQVPQLLQDSLFKDKFKKTPLYYASRKKRQDVIQFFNDLKIPNDLAVAR